MGRFAAACTQRVRAAATWPELLTMLGDGRGESVVVIRLKGREKTKSLSHREMAILEMFANGRSTSEVAEHFGISAESVKIHLERIFEKLRANDPQPEPPHRRSS